MADCPSCGREVVVEILNGVSVPRCSDCDGLWLAAGDLDKLTGQSLEAQLSGWLGEPTECRYCDTPLGFGADCVRCGKPPTLQCPRGHGVMDATLIELGQREFEIDRCRSCRGIWIDGHEREHLHAVDPPLVRKLKIEQPPPGLDRVGQGGSGRRASSSFLSAVSDELSYFPSYAGDDPNALIWRAGRREPLEIIFFLVVIGGAIALLYYISGGSLIAL